MEQEAQPAQAEAARRVAKELEDRATTAAAPTRGKLREKSTLDAGRPMPYNAASSLLPAALLV
jgi:hypothetical protein